MTSRPGVPLRMSGPFVPVIVQADSDVPTGLFVRVIDEAKLAGAAKVSVATKS